MMKRLLGVLCFSLLLADLAQADTIVYGFDDGTFQGWEQVLPDGSPFPVDDSDISWIPSSETIDIGDGFSLLTATSGDYRVIPDPWATRDCLGGAFCYTQILRSPTFQLDGSGDLTIDMIGGAARADVPFDSLGEEAPTDPDFFNEFKDGTGFQGFAVLDVEANEYVAHGFSSGENDGKARATDPAYRAVWDTVTIPQADLAPFANNGKEYRVDIFDSFSGGWGWIGFDTVTIPGTNGDVQNDPGDFDGNGLLEAADINALSTAVATGDMASQFDLDGNGSVEDADRTFWVNDLRNTYFGDANLDGEFNSSDLVTVFTAGQYEDGVADNSGWAEGDWNGDGEFDSSDFVVAFGAGGYEIGPKGAVSSVPEPNALIMVMAGLLGMAATRRRR
ncbi:MAG: PEP-CTERM sorting domain-containing protein [Pirellulaceae bacterium]